MKNFWNWAVRPAQNVEPVAVADKTGVRKATEFRADPRSANPGTPRGLALLKESVDTCGYGRPVCVDKNGIAIAGGKVLQDAQARGADVDVVQTTGHELVVVQREDLDCVEDPKARQLAYYDNRVRELDAAWTPPQLQADLLAGVNLQTCFLPKELHRLLPATQAPILVAAAPLPVEIPSAPKTDIVFDDVEQHNQWVAFLRLLEQRYPQGGTDGTRLLMYLREIRLLA